MAVGLTHRRRLRGYDAVHLAAALTVLPALSEAGLAPLVFVTADRDLLQAANAEGLEVEDPNRH